MSLLLAAITLILGGIIVVAQYGDSQPNDPLVRLLKRILPTKLSFSRLQLIAGLSVVAVSLVFQVVTARENQQKDQMLAQQAKEVARLRESVEHMRQEAAKESRQKEQLLAQQSKEITRLHDNVKHMRQENREFSRRLVNLQAKNLRLSQKMAEMQLKPDDNSKMALASLLPGHDHNPPAAELSMKEATVATVGLVSAIVDPRYSQSEEIGSMDKFGYDSASDIINVVGKLQGPAAQARIKRAFSPSFLIEPWKNGFGGLGKYL
jgi:hypothetical protein